MSKYVIKNCECKVKGKTTLCIRDIPYKKCENITDCKLKQIVELCREELNSLETYVDVRSLECITLQNILKLLDIQEVG